MTEAIERPAEPFVTRSADLAEHMREAGIPAVVVTDDAVSEEDGWS